MHRCPPLKTPVLICLLAASLACCTDRPAGNSAIRFQTERPGLVSLNIHRADGTLAGPLLSAVPYPAGRHEIAWDGRLGGDAFPPGDYSWRAVWHEELNLKLRGTVGDFGGDRGVPSAVASDNTQVYLGWSLAGPGADAVVACDAAGTIRWRHRRGTLSGCRALGVDAGAVYVLGGEGPDAEGGTVYKLSARDGTPLPWPDGRTGLRITSLWSGDGKGGPQFADYMAVKNERLFLSFTASEFMAVLDGRTGAYLQTVVGAPPGAVDSTATKTDLPNKPGELVAADFVVTALKGAVLGKLLLVHDPIWVVVSDLTPLDRDERITALSMIGDGAKYHMHDIFIALGAPFHQVQARSALASDGFTYTAGKAGGRPPLGPWVPGAMQAVRGVALDATGQLWVAEGDAIPRRISVWSTDKAEGRLVREFFAPPGAESPAAAVHPLDPQILFAGGCEWRFDPATRRAACLGVITREPMSAARYAVEKERVFLVLQPAAPGPELVFERTADGDCKPHDGPAPAASSAAIKLVRNTAGAWQFVSADGFILGDAFKDLPQPTAATISLSANGQASVTAIRTRVESHELAGFETLRPLGSGQVTLPPRGQKPATP